MTSNNRGSLGRRLGGAIAAASFTALLCACGGGGGPSASGGSSGGGSANANVAAVTIDAGPTITAADGCTPTDVANGCVVGGTPHSVDIPYVSVTVCPPGSKTNCQTIDHIGLDTGSSGLRIISTVLTASLMQALPATKNNAGQALTECAQFGSGGMWGTVRTADIHIATTGSGTEEVASAVNIQIAGDTAASLEPTSCASLPSLNDVYAAGTNGFLGVGLFVNDCITAATCPAGQSILMYFNCPSGASSCNEVAAESNHQVANPVATMVASDGIADNKGIIVELPAISDSGAPTATGSLVFGIASRSNNALTSAQQVVVSDAYGNMNAQLLSPKTYGGTGSQVYSQYSFFDSGSNGIYLPGTTIPCDTANGGWFTPATTLSFAATVQGASDSGLPNPTPVAVSFPFLIGNATTLLNTLYTAFNDLGLPASACSGSPGTGSAPGPAFPNGGIDFGLPAFFGRNMYVGLETSKFAVGSTTYYGPLWAF